MTKEEIRAMSLKDFNDWISKLVKEKRFSDVKLACQIRGIKINRRNDVRH